MIVYRVQLYHIYNDSLNIIRRDESLTLIPSSLLIYKFQRYFNLYIILLHSYK